MRCSRQFSAHISQDNPLAAGDMILQYGNIQGTEQDITTYHSYVNTEGRVYF